MQPHQQRVVDEKKELDDKLTKLHAFFTATPTFESLDSAEQSRLRRQAELMGQYSAILGERIAAFV